MKYIITEKQYVYISEQGTLSPPGGYEWEKPDAIKKQHEMQMKSLGIDVHEYNQLHALIYSFIPVIGPVIGGSIGLADAKMLWDEGEKKEAGLVALFSLIPAIGGLANKLGLSKWTSKALSEIAKKINLGTKLSSLEVQVVKNITKNKKFIESEVQKLGKEGVVQAVKRIAVTNAKKIGKEVAKYAAIGTAYSKGYDAINSNDPKVKVSKENMDWAFVKNAFGSSGSKEDNEKLNQAWDAGWRPGQVVPEKFQLEKYRIKYKEETDNMNTLAQLIASVKNKNKK